MQLCNIISLAFLALVPLTSAHCRESGPSKVHKSTIQRAIRPLCIGRMLGHYHPGESRYSCIQDGNDAKWEFTLKLRDDVDERTIEIDECVDGFTKEVSNCTVGGSTEYCHWKYTADANKGACIDLKYYNSHGSLLQEAIHFND